MKTKYLFGMMALIAVFSLNSCSKDSSSPDSKLTSADAVATNKMDKASNDISDVVEDQYLQLPGANKTSNTYTSILPACATSVVNITSTSWTRTVTFNNCVFNGNTLTGQIVASGTLPLPSDASTGYTINYQFVNFTHNGILIEGNRSITRRFASSQLSSNNHPIHVMDMNMTATFPNGDVYTRVGTRTRECVENFGNNNLNDNVYKVYQSITTTRPNGSQHSHVVSITSPLVFDMSCQYKLVGGILTITGPLHSAVIDYGSGTCDNDATIAIDGGAATAFTFGN